MFLDSIYFTDALLLTVMTIFVNITVQQDDVFFNNQKIKFD